MLRASAIVLALLTASPAFASSREAREGKRYDLSAQLIGIMGIVPATGVTAGYYVEPDLIVEVGYAAGRVEQGGSDDDYDSEAYAAFAFASAKIFTLDTFFVNVGLAQRAFDATLVAEGPTALAGDDERTSVATRYLGVLAGVGNRWQWETVHVGGEWGGVFMPLVKQKKEIDYSLAMTPAGPHDEQDESQSLVREGTQMSLNILRFTVGVAF